jgi:hypothetical protein
MPARAAIPTPLGRGPGCPGQGLLIFLCAADPRITCRFVCRTCVIFLHHAALFDLPVLELQRRFRCSFAADHHECHADRSSAVRPFKETGNEKMPGRCRDTEQGYRGLRGRDCLLCRLRAKKCKPRGSRKGGSTTSAAQFRLRLDNVRRALPRPRAQSQALPARRRTPALALGTLAPADVPCDGTPAMHWPHRWASSQAARCREPLPHTHLYRSQSAGVMGTTEPLG